MADDDLVTEEERNAIYRAIGNFIVEFAYLEATLRAFLAMEVRMRLDFAPAIITHDFSLLCTAVVEVFSQTVDDRKRREELIKCVKGCRELNDLRVRVAHGHWVMEEGGGVVAHVSRQKLQTFFWDEMRHHLERSVAAATSLRGRLERFHAEHVESKKDERARRKRLAGIGKLFP